MDEVQRLLPLQGGLVKQGPGPLWGNGWVVLKLRGGSE